MKDMLLGIEIGGTKLQAAIGTEQGELIDVCRENVNIEKGAQWILDWMQHCIPELIHRNGELKTKLRAIGCGFGGPINSLTGLVLKSNQISGWDNFPLKEWMEDSFQLPVYVENDTNAAAWAEYQMGFGRGTQNFFYTNIGSGIGGGLIVNGALYTAQGDGAGEFGHMLIPNGLIEGQDNVMEIEALCSGWAIEERLRTPGYIPEESDLYHRLGSKIVGATTSDLARSAETGDAFALSEINKVAQAIGIGLANVQCLMNVEKIAIGGGVSKMGEILLKPIRHYTDKYVYLTTKGRYYIKQSELGDDIVLVGALRLASSRA